MGRAMTAVEILLPQEFCEGPICICSWLRPEGAPRAPLAVLICPGSPTEKSGSSHAGAPLIIALARALVKENIPVVTFDYQGVGRSEPNGNSEDPKAWEVPGDQEAILSVTTAVAWTKSKLSDRIVIFTDSIVQEILEKSMERQDCRTRKAPDMTGEEDSTGPKINIQGLIAGRVIPPGLHRCRGQEDKIGAMCAEWVAGLREELPPEEEWAPVKAAEETVGGLFDFDALDPHDSLQAKSDVNVKHDKQVDMVMGA